MKAKTVIAIAADQEKSQFANIWTLRYTGAADMDRDIPTASLMAIAATRGYAIDWRNRDMSAGVARA